MAVAGRSHNGAHKRIKG